jgi:hypothetical protein
MARVITLPPTQNDGTPWPLAKGGGDLHLLWCEKFDGLPDGTVEIEKKKHSV